MAKVTELNRTDGIAAAVKPQQDCPAGMVAGEPEGCVVCGDCLDVMAAMDAASVDTIITDPPYGLQFMGKAWDHGVPGVPFWQAALRVAKCGAFLLAFGGTRTHHRLACAIEDAGWEIRDCVMWLYGQGFPKSLDISKAIDKAAGAEREKIQPGTPPAYQRGIRNTRPWMDDPEHKIDGPVPATEAAKLWNGWGTALKPSWELIVVAMKPTDGTFANNALTHGVAGLNIDGGRIGTTKRVPGSDYIDAPSWLKKHGCGGGYGPRTVGMSGMNANIGRWPANVILSHHPDCVRVGQRKIKGNRASRRGGNTFGGDLPYKYRQGEHILGRTDPDGTETVEDWRCHPDCPVRLLDEQSGQSASPEKVTRGRNRQIEAFGLGRQEDVPCFGDSGGASRFFYCAKASSAERNAGCDDFYWQKDKTSPIGVVRVSQGVWAKLDETQRARGNIHPTVKPLAIMEYLCRLTATPTGGVVFDPFCGSGTTLVAARNLGRPYIGIDTDADYCEIARARLAAGPISPQSEGVGSRAVKGQRTLFAVGGAG